MREDNTKSSESECYAVWIHAGKGLIGALFMVRMLPESNDKKKKIMWYVLLEKRWIVY
jgi:hypothetical protein